MLETQTKFDRSPHRCTCADEKRRHIVWTIESHISRPINTTNMQSITCISSPMTTSITACSTKHPYSFRCDEQATPSDTRSPSRNPHKPFKIEADLPTGLGVAQQGANNCTRRTVYLQDRPRTGTVTEPRAFRIFSTWNAKLCNDCVWLHKNVASRTCAERGSLAHILE